MEIIRPEHIIIKSEKELIKIPGRMKLILEDIHTGELDVSEWYNNLITTVWKVANLRRWKNSASKANEGMVTYLAVGTGTTAPAIGDTTLETEVARVTISLASSISGTTLELRGFFNTSQANAVLREAAWFGEDAGAGADSGTMVNHVAINRTKTVTKTLTIVQEFAW